MADEALRAKQVPPDPRRHRAVLHRLPTGKTLLQTVEDKSTALSFTDDALHMIVYAGVAAGSVLWLGLSRVLFSVIVPSMPDSLFAHNVTLIILMSLNGVLSASRLLFIVWKFNEDFHGGFQVACKRIGVLESLRTAVGMLAVISGYAGMEYIYRSIVSLVSLATLVLLFKAPRCFCADSLPFTRYLEGLAEHKSFWLLLVLVMLNHLTAHASNTYHDWWSLNGWSPTDS